MLTIILALVAALSAGGVVLSRQAVHSALNLTVNLLTVGLLYLSLGLPFLGMAQLLIYAGAIMVVFLFAVTVLAPDEEKDLHTLNFPLFAGAGAAAILGAPLIIAACNTHADLQNLSKTAGAVSLENPVSGSLHAFAMELFHKFVFPFEATAFLLLVALIGAVLLGHRRLKSAGIPTQPPRPKEASDA